IMELVRAKTGTPYEKALTAPIGLNRQIYLDLLKERLLSHIPITNNEGQIVGLVTSDEFIVDSVLDLHAVVMAGGLGTRLMPLTEHTPKPMLRVGEKPLLEIIVDQLRQAGIQKVNVTTHHHSEKIKEHFGNGYNFGVDISYVSEERPLGTAGALSLLEQSGQTMLIINGDILTDVDFRAMHNFHKEHDADLTVAVRSYEMEVPYGVIESNGVVVREVREKPRISWMVNAGIYLLEPHVQRLVPTGQSFNMTDLIQQLLEENLNVISFPIHEYWLDIGAHAEYKKAQEEFQKRKL
ncbi:MAG: nucleotidyltransferase family protein, partial [Deltaproteobacteria bacterium]|nr:nucleotidyltransferase family protein [Deltaproteobacteria bacterium]